MGSDKSSRSSKDTSAEPTIWDLLSNPELAPQDDLLDDNTTPAAAVVPIEEGSRDSFTLVVGSQGCGKSTSITHFLNPTKEDKPKPTAALDYTFARKSVPGLNSKAVAHIWELAASKRIRDMVKLPLTVDRICNTRIVIVIDMSRPGNAIQTLTQWLDITREVVDIALAEKARNSSRDKKAVKSLKKSRIEALARHADEKDMNPFPVPLLILAAKFDTFYKEDSIKRKVLVQALRYIAHLNFATLQAFTTAEKSIASAYRNVMTSHLFGSDVGKPVGHETDSAVSLSIGAGTDSFEDIGIPRGARSREDFASSTLDAKIDQWVQATEEFFPAEKIVKNSTHDESDEEKEEVNEFPETAVDAMRAQKRDELARYCKEAARKQKLEGSSSSSSSGTRSRKSSSRKKSVE